MRIFRELAVLGNLLVTAHLEALPSYRDMHPGRCYLSWSLSLVSDAPEAAIREIFEWVNADCNLAVKSSSGTLPPPQAAAAIPAVAPPVPPAPVALAEVAQPVAALPAANALDSGSIRVGVEKIDELINTVGELVITHAMLEPDQPWYHRPGG